MTAEEYANEHFDRSENEDMWCIIANSFNVGKSEGRKEALAIAEQAVEEGLIVLVHSDSLSRIKTLTEE
jgi:hypothetical protein